LGDNFAHGAGSSFDFIVDVPWNVENKEGILKKGRYLVFVEEGRGECKMLFYSTSVVNDQAFSAGVPKKKPAFIAQAQCLSDAVDTSLENPIVEVFASENNRFLIIYFETIDKKAKRNRYVMARLRGTQ
jgi:hypothetical protein